MKKKVKVSSTRSALTISEKSKVSIVNDQLIGSVVLFKRRLTWPGVAHLTDVHTWKQDKITYFSQVKVGFLQLSG